MEQIKIRKEDQLIMSLVHYFVTEKNYSPILVHGVKDEIWLENDDGPYKVVRINSNKIINDEQFEFDQYKVNDILHQIKRKTFSFSINALIINLNEDYEQKESLFKNIDTISIKSIDDIKNNELLNSAYSSIKTKLYDKTDGLDLIFNTTKEINAKTERDNKRYEKIFSKKSPLITHIIITLCLIGFIFSYGPYNLISSFGTIREGLLMGEYYRMITYAFLHGGLFHLICNMYSLVVIGVESENKFGKIRYIIIYLISAIGASLLSALFNTGLSIGASGAIFGLLGAYLYFGTRFRLYFGTAIRYQILPVIIINLVVGFTLTGIDNAAHVGGLIAGYLTAMAVGIPNDKKKVDSINGIILLLIYFAFLVYMVFFR